jgi:hypothetical protein
MVEEVPEFRTEAQQLSESNQKKNASETNNYEVGLCLFRLSLQSELCWVRWHNYI